VKNRFDWTVIKQLDEPARMTLIYTQAASYIGSFVLGIRDRHQVGERAGSREE
jgi:hypothetical protein